MGHGGSTLPERSGVALSFRGRPDFIPIIGYLDDLILIPMGLALVVRLTPPEVIESARAQAQQASTKPVSYSAAAFVIVVWLIVMWLFGKWTLSLVRA
ncbi:YkvA family protein [Pseudomonas leptonychotis]|uniref:YkvA family protein n=1 Tax=Pseudomonas leptonychotis TaxID=2448482 RepID=UPI00386C33C7